MSITVSTATDLQNAVNNPPLDGLIYIGDDILIPQPAITIPVCSTITIESAPGTTYTMTSEPGAMVFYVYGNVTLQNIICSGGTIPQPTDPTLSGSGIWIYEGGIVTTNTGFVLQNTTRSTSPAAYSGFMQHGTLIMNDGLITQNYSDTYASAIYTGVTAIGATYRGKTCINGGTISYNANGYATVTTIAGAVCASYQGDTYISGGEIINNTVRQGGVAVQSNCNVYMTGGTIANNVSIGTSTYSVGGICIRASNQYIFSSLYLCGGTITNNTGYGSQPNGGVYIDAGQYAYISGGSIDENNGTGIYNAGNLTVDSTLPCPCPCGNSCTQNPTANPSIQNNTAAGIISAAGSTTTINNVSLLGNTGNQITYNGGSLTVGGVPVTSHVTDAVDLPFSPPAAIDTLPPSLSGSKSASLSTVKVGGTVTYTINVVNNGPGPTTGFNFTDCLPACLTANGLPSATIDGVETVVTAENTNNFATADQILAGGQALITYAATVSDLCPCGTTFNNVATLYNGCYCDSGIRLTDAGVTTVCFDLTATKSASPTSVAPGQIISYDLTIQNDGSGPTSDLLISDPLPGGSVFVPSTAVALFSDGTLGTVTTSGPANAPVFAITPQLAAGDSVTLSYQVQFPTTAAVGATYQNTAAITGSDDPNETPVTATDDGVNIALPDFSVSKSVDNPSPAIGGYVNYTITATNTGSVPSVGLLLTDNLPPTMTFSQHITVDVDGIVVSDATLLSTNPLTLNIPETIPPGATATVTFQALVEGNLAVAGNPLVNSATATPQLPGVPNLEPSAPGTVTIIPSALPYSVTKDVDDPTPPLGATVNYTTIVAPNLVPSSLGMTLTDTMPPGVSYTGGPVTADINGTLVTDVTTTLSGNQLTINVPDYIPANSTLTVTYPATVTSDPSQAGVAQTNSITVMPNTQPGAPNLPYSAAATSTLVPLAPTFTMSKSADNHTPALGSTINYTLTAIHTGKVPAAVGLTFTDTLPDGMTYLGPVTVQVNGTPISGSETTISGNTLTINVPQDLGVGDTVTASFLATVTTDPSQVGSTQTNSATVTPNVPPGADPLPPSAPATVNVIPTTAHLYLTKTATPTTAMPGDTVTYQITVINTGVIPALGFSVTDTLQNGSISGLPMTYIPGSATLIGGLTPLTDNYPDFYFDVPAMGTATLTFQAQVPEGAASNDVFSNVATGNSPYGISPDPTPPTNVQVQEPTSPQVSALKFVSHADARPNGTVTYSIVVTNKGNAPTQGFAVTDPLPSGSMGSGSMTFVPSSASVSGSVSGLTGTYPNFQFDVPAGGTAILTFDATLPPTAKDGEQFGNSASFYLENGTPPPPTPPVVTTVSQPAVTATKAVDLTSVSPGGILTYTITVVNNGSEATQDFSVTDLMSQGQSYVAGSSSVDNSVAGLTDQYPDFFFDVPANTTATLTFQALVDADAANYTVLGNQATFSMSNGTPPHITVPTTTDVLRSALTATKTVDPTEASPGETVSYTITVDNSQGTAPVSDFTVVDPLADGVSYVPESASLTGSSSGLTAGYPDFTFDIPAGGVAVLTFDATLPADAVPGDTFQNSARFQMPSGTPPPQTTPPAMVAIKPAPCPTSQVPILTAPPATLGTTVPLSTSYIVPTATENLTLSSDLPPCLTFPTGGQATVSVNGISRQVANSGTAQSPEFLITGPFNVGDLVTATFNADVDPACQPGTTIHVSTTLTNDQGDSHTSNTASLPVKQPDTLFAQYKCETMAKACGNLPLGITSQFGQSVTRGQDCNLKDPFTLAPGGTYQVEWSAVFQSSSCSRFAKIGLTLDDKRLYGSEDCVKADPCLDVPMSGSLMVSTGMFASCLALSNWTKCNLNLKSIKLTITQID